MDKKTIWRKIYELSQKTQTKVYVVGGYVRDYLLGFSSKKDIDFVVIGSGLDFARQFVDYIGYDKGSLLEFADFDTARFIFTKNLKSGQKKTYLEIEFAGARTEIYKEDSRKPQVKHTDLYTDLQRRDFTINALASLVIKTGFSKKIIDLFSGQKDLKNKLIRTPLDPNETFSEDPLRMLRAARFASQLNFKIEAKTYQALITNKHRLKIISAERIKEELFKLLMTPKPSVGLWILYKTGLLNEFLPEISALAGVEEKKGYTHKNNLAHTFQVVDNIAKKTDKVLLRLAALLHDIGKPQTKKFIKGRGWTFDMHEHLGRKMTRDIGRRLRLSKKETEYIAKLVRWHQQPKALTDKGITDTAVRRLIVNLGVDLNDLLILCRSDITTANPNRLAKRLRNYDNLEKRINEIMEKDKLRSFQSPLSGEEIMKLTNLKPGPTVGKIKKAIEEAILNGEIRNNYQAAKKYFKTIKDKFLQQAYEWEKKSN